MSILMTCPSCSAKMNAPDHLAGKKAKCPKCGKAAPVPATAATAARTAPGMPKKSATTAVGTAKPTVKKKAPRAEARSVDATLPLRSFDELKVPASFRARIENEIGSDDVVWIGRPNPRKLYRQAWIGSAFGLIMTLLSPASLLILLMESTEESRWIMMAVAIGLGVILLLFGLPMLFMPILVRLFVNFRPVYVLTNKRAIVAHNRFGIMASIWSYDRFELGGRIVEEGDNGVGSITMGYEIYKHQGRTVHKEKVYKDEQGNTKLVVTTIKRKKGHTSEIAVGFLDVDDMLKVEALLRRTLKLPAKSDS